MKKMKIVKLTVEGAEQIFHYEDVGAKGPLTIKGWQKAIEKAGYRRPNADMIS